MELATNKTILVVDDEPALREILRDQFEAEGFRVLTAESGRRAYEINRVEKVDLVVSDIQMPDGDGVELLKKIRAEDRPTPFLFISGFSNLTLEQAFDYGAEGIFPKPFDPDALLSCARNCLVPKDNRWPERALRTEAKLDVHVKLSSVDTLGVTQLLNLGRGGLFVAMEGYLPEVDDKIHFRIDFTHDRGIRIEGIGRVRWVRREGDGQAPAGCGIEFLELSKACRNSLLEVINALKTRPYIPRI